MMREMCLLIKAVSSLFIGISALFGFFAAGSHDLALALALFTGILFLVAGCSALNQYQERNLDGDMDRTKGRPLPAGHLNPIAVLRFSGALTLAGLALLWYFQPWSVVLVGILGVAIYNLGYTPLKSASPFAILFGAVAGCLPPLMGWLSAGRDALDQTLWIGLAFAYFWQIAHFGLLLLAYPEDYSRSLRPNLYKTLGKSGVMRMTILSMFLCLFSAWSLGAGLPAAFPGLVGAWFQWIQLIIVLAFCGVTLRGLASPGKPAFHLWNSWLGLGMLIGIASFILA